MDYEKKYKDTLEMARNLYPGVHEHNKKMLEQIFPELAESEDERIRKEIIGYLESKVSTAEETELLYFKRWIAWLEKQKDKNCLACDQHLKGYLAGRKVTEEEKQKEQKPAEWSEEEEEMLEYIIGDVNDAKQLYTTQEAKDMADKEIAWLKSLRPGWKPSEEQSQKKL